MVYFVLIFGAVLMIITPTYHEGYENHTVEHVKPRRYSRCEHLKDSVNFINNPAPILKHNK